MAMDPPRPFARPPAEPPAPMPMDVEPPARRMDLQLEASFAPASRPAGPLMPSGPARVPIPMTRPRGDVCFPAPGSFSGIHA